jgi:aspartyl-tRNA(Asn)/glutamyl-tRNA(Gln) amidotransferase subunit A
MANYDLLITPTLAVPAFPLYMQGPEIIEEKMVTTGDWLCFTFICNLTGQPAATIPAGFTNTGLPVGMQIIGRHLADRTVLAASGAFEQARPWANKWPKLLGDLGL